MIFLAKYLLGYVVASKGNKTCYVNPPIDESETTVGYRWQRCSEMVMPIGIDNTKMFPPDPFDLSNYIDDCKNCMVFLLLGLTGSLLIMEAIANQDSDPDWLVMQRKAEVEIIEGWISKYYADLKAVQ
ncbi:prolylcarboxypeptidase-like protein [Citrus sinensis]|nr:prolylcarboxypeptidase-like protein [Citrus sinensis]